ncbi:20460_t:CDS:1, partial [Dentiscutata erythropus]
LHLNSQGQVIDLELATKNFSYAENTLRDLWNRDPLFGKLVATCYIDKNINSFR